MLAIDIVILIIAIIVGCLGNFGLMVMSLFTKFFHSLFIVNVATFDVLSVLFGSSVHLLSYTKGYTWFMENPSVCQALGFLTSFTNLASIIGWLCLTIYCRQIHLLVPKVRLFRLLLILSWFVAIALASFGLALGTYTFEGHLKICSTNSNGYLYFITALSFCIQILALVLSCFAFRDQRRYHLRLQWKIHKHEIQLDDPERTTFQNSQSESSVTYSIENLLVTLANTKRQGSVESLGPVKTLKTLMFAEIAKDGETSPLVDIAISTNKNVSRAHVLDSPDEEQYSSKQGKELVQTKVYTIPLKDESSSNRERISKFKSSISLSETNKKNDRENRQFLVIVIIVTCLSLIGWLPQYFAIFLHLSDVTLPESVISIIQWLTHVKAIFGPFIYLIFCRQYKHVVSSTMCRIRKYLCSCYTFPQQRRGSVNLSKNTRTDILENVVLQSFSRVQKT